ncbi:arabinan endo-1,5-alpha-L-arabinosidase [Sinomicrobium soli]|uniref:arabinan endo-1,5-alpha-L-arabinosidase n=1 Tax=Sinomicrobium sp. N-1-3-6 TaxID=2219864 RepID=UPI001374DD16|nr:arabinan endo-1,5-alpha-L-arabinosidase [Sinomicrobium sp. N-1-3-6]
MKPYFFSRQFIPFTFLFLLSLSCKSSDEQAPPVPEEEQEQQDPAPEMTGITGLKDTSRLIRSDGKIFCYATGGGIRMIWASSLSSGQWNTGPDVFPERPAWWAGYSPINIAWAPDVVFDEKSSEYRMYYCVSKLGSSTSAIGLATNKTLNPDNPEYGWIDQGIVISSIEGVDGFNALDPCPVQRPDGAWFLTFGSHFGGIKLIRLGEDGKMHPGITEISDLARKENTFRNAIEAPALYPGTKNGEEGFWLFVNWGTGNSIANGENATYEVKMGWSQDIRGPYLDKEGNSMYDGGGTVFLSNQQTFEWDESTRIAPGHVGLIYGDKLDGTHPDWVSYSYWLKNPPARNGIRMGIQRLGTDEDGWPEAGALFKYDY